MTARDVTATRYSTTAGVSSPWFFVALMIVLGIAPAYAQQVCPSGQEVVGLQWVLMNTGQSAARCDIFSSNQPSTNPVWNSVSAADAYVAGKISACGGGAYQESGYPRYAQFSGQWRRHYFIRRGGSAADFTAQLVCGVPTCDVPQHQELGARRADSSNTTACVNNCSATAHMTVTVTPQGGSPYIGYMWRSTGQACSGQTPDTSDGPILSVGGHHSGPAPDLALGDELTMDDPETPSNETAVNGFHQPNMTPVQGCVTTASGAMYCLSQGGEVEPPDNGTPGQPATPDAQVETRDTRAQTPGQGNSTTYDY